MLAKCEVDSARQMFSAPATAGLLVRLSPAGIILTGPVSARSRRVTYAAVERRSVRAFASPSQAIRMADMMAFVAEE